MAEKQEYLITNILIICSIINLPVNDRMLDQLMSMSEELLLAKLEKARKTCKPFVDIEVFIADALRAPCPPERKGRS